MATVAERRSGILMWWGWALVGGLATGASMLILSLDFYVQLTSVLDVMVVSALSVLTGTWLWRNRDNRKPLLMVNIVTAGGQLIVFAVGVFLMIWLLLLIYPPNFS